MRQTLTLSHNTLKVIYFFSIIHQHAQFCLVIVANNHSDNQILFSYNLVCACDLAKYNHHNNYYFSYQEQDYYPLKISKGSQGSQVTRASGIYLLEQCTNRYKSGLWSMGQWKYNLLRQKRLIGVRNKKVNFRKGSLKFSSSILASNPLNTCHHLAKK